MTDITQSDKMMTATGNYADDETSFARFILSYYLHWLLGFIVK